MSRKKMTLLFISSDKYPPFRVDSAVLFGEEMKQRGHQIDWIMQSEKPCKHSYQTIWKGSRVWVGATDLATSRIGRLRKHLLGILHQLKLFKLLRENHYDFIQVKNKYLIAIVAALAARLYHTRFIFWLSYPHAEESLFKVREGVARYPVFYFIKGHVLTFIVYKLVMPLANHVFVQSEQMKKDVASRGIPEAKLTPVPMGVSLTEFEPYRAAGIRNIEKGWGNRKSIVYLGTIQSARKMDFMVRVLKLVLQDEPDAFLYFVGDGDGQQDRDTLERTAMDLGISDSMMITGFMPRADAMNYVRSADVCVSPFYPGPILNSTSPTKIVEYMAMGKAVVANDHPEQCLIIKESSGGICVPYDESAFAKAIVELLRNPGQAEEMGRCGRQYVEKYRDYRKIADLVENKYYEILAEGPRQAGQ